VNFQALPSEGYKGEAPDFPLGRVSVYYVYKDDKGKPVREFDEEATQERHARELELWAWAWTTPQAAAWSRERWRWYSVAMWVRTFALCESSEAQAADKNSLHRFADQIGLSPAGLAGNGWVIARDEVGARREPEPSPSANPSGGRLSARERRLKAVGGEK